MRVVGYIDFCFVVLIVVWFRCGVGVELTDVWFGCGYGVMGYGWVFLLSNSGGVKMVAYTVQYWGLAIEGIFEWILGLLSRVILV